VAAIVGTLTTATLKGIRENLTDVIYNISPTKTPFFQMAGRAKATNTLHEWQTDALASPDTANFRNEGNDATFAVPAATVRLGNYNQISDKTAIVSGTSEAVTKAGRKSEMGMQMAKRSAELKRDLETISLSNQAADGTDPRKTAGMCAWLKTNIDKATDGSNPVYTTLPNATRTDGTQRALTEALLKNVIQLCWTEGAEPSIISVGAFNKSVISSFGGNADKVVNLGSGAKPGVIVAAMDVYVSDFGNLKVVANRFQRARDLFVWDPEYVSIGYLRPFATKELAKTGDAEKRLINVEWFTKVHNEKAHGAVYDLLTA
jgi:hypothetical protein